MYVNILIEIIISLFTESPEKCLSAYVLVLLALINVYHILCFEHTL